MKKVTAFALLLVPVLLLQNCKSKPVNSYNFTETSDTLTFFPINIYLQGQLNKIDSQATVVYKILINGASRDSSIISKQELWQLAYPFLAYDITSKPLHKYFKENVFADQTTKSIIFNYTAMVDTLPLRSVNILMDSTGERMKNIFMSVEKTSGDSTITEKAGWKNDESFFINRSIQKGDNAPTMQRTVVVWRF